MKRTFILEDLDCAHCAQKIEDAVAKIAGVSRTYLYKILKHEVKNPGVETLKKIAKAMNCSVKKLGY